MFTETLVLCCVFLKRVNATNFDDALIYCCLIFITGKTTTRPLRSHSGLLLVKLSTAFIYLVRVRWRYFWAVRKLLWKRASSPQDDVAPTLQEWCQKLRVVVPVNTAGDTLGLLWMKQFSIIRKIGHLTYLVPLCRDGVWTRCDVWRRLLWMT